MKMQAFLSAVWGVGLLLVLNGALLESARYSWRAPQTMFVFGDSFVDTGNIKKADPGEALLRQWYYPYGISNDEGTDTQGRFSDFMVQSDFIARMLGLPLSPPTEQSTLGADHCSPDGTNFAFGSSGVFEISAWSNLRNQVDDFRDMIQSGIISKNRVTHSVALISSSAEDYKHFGVRRSPRVNTEFIRNVTTELAVNVERLQNLGVKRILVNNLHPLGCTPSLCRESDYRVCNDASNKDALEHNRYLEEKLGTKKGVLIVDMHTAFDTIMGHRTHEQGEDSEFKHRRRPCCESFDPNGFCGQQSNISEPLYFLCANPAKYFFWDDANPTHAGWEAVMAQIQDPIKEFLGIV